METWVGENSYHAHGMERELVSMSPRMTAHKLDGTRKIRPSYRLRTVLGPALRTLSFGFSEAMTVFAALMPKCIRVRPPN